ncbi:MAG: SpoIIIAH-like family protein [Bacilli bacterium]|jgi:stage III sporulation protein AH
MINKQSLWFLTLFSLILVLSVYYITMPSELLLTDKDQFKNFNEGQVNIEESEILAALRLENDKQRFDTQKELKMVLTNLEASVNEKNAAYEELKVISVLKGKEEKLEAKIKEKFSLNAFIKIDNNQVRVVVDSADHDTKLANDIMRSIQEEFPEKVYISVKFQS